MSNTVFEISIVSECIKDLIRGGIVNVWSRVENRGRGSFIEQMRVCVVSRCTIEPSEVFWRSEALKRQALEGALSFQLILDRLISHADGSCA